MASLSEVTRQTLVDDSKPVLEQIQDLLSEAPEPMSVMEISKRVHGEHWRDWQQEMRGRLQALVLRGVLQKEKSGVSLLTGKPVNRYELSQESETPKDEIRTEEPPMAKGTYSSRQIVESWLTYEIEDAEVFAAKLREAGEYHYAKLASFRFLLADVQQRDGAATNLVPRAALYESESVEEPPQPEVEPPEPPQPTSPEAPQSEVEPPQPEDGAIKVCSTCSEPKPMEMFNKRTSAKDGHQPMCRDCDGKRCRDYRESLQAGPRPVPEPNATKVCPKCGELKLLEMFSLHKGRKDGRQSYCRECCTGEGRDYREKVQAGPRPVVEPDATKVCPKCGELKLLVLFTLNKGAKDGRHGYCRECHAKYSQERRAKKPPEPSEEQPTQPGHCVRCNARMSTAGEYPTCSQCGWEDYGWVNPVLERSGYRKDNG